MGMTLGLNLDGVIMKAPDFSSALTYLWLAGKLIAITSRLDRVEVTTNPEDRNIRFDEFVLVNRFEAKAEVIKEHIVAMYIDDQTKMQKLSRRESKSPV